LTIAWDFGLINGMHMKFKTNRKYFDKDWTISKVTKEIDQGLKLLNKINHPIITVLGSHKPKPGSKYYKQAYELAKTLGENGYAIATGGGPGIMEAANKGAAEAQAVSIGIRANLIKNEKINHQYFTKQSSYHFLFVRRFILSLKSSALVFFPGGLGTLNELFEYLVLIQLGFIDKVPVICVDRKYWKGMFDWLKSNPKKENFYINAMKDLNLVQFADTSDQVLKLIKKSGL
jgi:uncharacterized protein (TIGR00730 family)